jgi:metal-responsive CopG/Arc/MetJ family transcriptional regulator
MGPGRGRPPIGRQIMVRIPDDLLAEIDRRAAEYGLTRAETMRRALAELLGAAIDEAMGQSRA